MSADRPTLPPVRLPSDAELARDALAVPLLARAVRLARWAGPGTRVGAGGELVEEQLAAAAEALGLLGTESPEPTESDEALAAQARADAEAEASEAWRVAVDTGLVEVEEPADEDASDAFDASDDASDDSSDDSSKGGDGADGGESDGTVSAGAALELIASGSPQDILSLWLDALDVVFADATAPVLEDLAGAIGDDGEIDLDALDWDPEVEAAFLEGVLGNLYLLTVGEGGTDPVPVPLPVLAASMIVPDDMGEPTDDVLEQVSDAMMRLDDQFALLEPIGLVTYVPVDEALMVEDAEAGSDALASGDDEDVSRYGVVTLTPLGLHGIRSRMRDAGVEAPVVGDLADKGADALLDGVAHFPEPAARAETEQWLARREPAEAARELLVAAKGSDPGAPLRRLHCQQSLALVGGEAEPAVREVLDDAELGGLARVWLAELGAADVPPPPESMIFWLAVDTIAAQLDAEGEPLELQELVEGLVGRHSGFFDAAWRVDHPATADVLEAMGRLHRDRKAAKEARKAAFKARSRTGS
ncbi:hypothetical protein [Streptomyces sp. NBC_01506]|uniref:hypothetical protein n=1 Tax=Streptomyces sp. NBC_01506 TaxID=2903887 RepID=UPI003868F399